MTTHRERPILMSTPMVRATLDGRKTETRRTTKAEGIIKCPYGRAGDLLWVRETWMEVTTSAQIGPDCATTDLSRVIYRADEPDDSPRRGWRPSIFMPKHLSRLWLRVTAVEVQRLHEITESDAQAEGFGEIAAFRDLWDTLNAKRGFGWDTNPWVWVVRYKIERITP